MTHVTCRLTAKNRDRLRNPTLGNRVRATFTLYLQDFVDPRTSDRKVDAGRVLPSGEWLCVHAVSTALTATDRTDRRTDTSPMHKACR